jgi:hypothetical protein
VPFNAEKEISLQTSWLRLILRYFSTPALDNSTLGVIHRDKHTLVAITTPDRGYAMG